MRKLQVFEVMFNSNVDIFRAGDMVAGYVRIVLNQKKDLKGVEITATGEANVHWTEEESHGSGDDQTSETIHYRSSETYLVNKFTVQMAATGKKKLHLEAGEHNFPFQFQLPTTSPLPPPFEGEFGQIRYKVQAEIKRPWKSSHVTEKYFNVTGPVVDLNYIPGITMPSQADTEKTVCCLCCASGPIKVSAQTDKGGYVPGETIWITGSCDNNSRRNINSLSAQLHQVTAYKGRREGRGQETTKTHEKVLLEFNTEGCGSHSVADFDRKPIQIPPCPPTGLVGCNIIHVDYYIKFIAHVSGTRFNAILKLPIRIGNVPLHSTIPAANQGPSQVITQQPSATPSFPPPPSYAEAVGGPKEIPSADGYDYTFGKLMYAPKYPYYNLQPTTGSEVVSPAGVHTYLPTAPPAQPGNPYLQNVPQGQPGNIYPATTPPVQPGNPYPHNVQPEQPGNPCQPTAPPAQMGNPYPQATPPTQSGNPYPPNTFSHPPPQDSYQIPSEKGIPTHDACESKM